MSKIELFTNLKEDTRGLKKDRYVSITVSASTHEKLNNLCWLIRDEKKPKMGLVTSNIIEHFIEENKEAILELQKNKTNLF